MKVFMVSASITFDIEASTPLEAEKKAVNILEEQCETLENLEVEIVDVT